MLKTKLFICNQTYKPKPIDESINEFLAEREGVEIVDVKLTATKDSYNDVHHALLIYKEPNE